MTRNKGVRRGLILLTLSLSATLTVAADDVRDWLKQMSQASQNLNYSGTFVYQHNGQLEAMQLIHRAADGAEQERLVALTGEAREVIRDQERVTCILPKRKAVMVDKSIPRKPFPAELPQDLDALNKHYDFLTMGEDRVSGLASKVVVIRPRDGFRYGYRLWLERDSHLLLRSDLVDADGQAIEQMMFTQMQIHDDVLDSAELVSALQGEDYTVIGHADPDNSEHSSAQEKSIWQVDWLPAGFMLTHRNQHQMPSHKDPVEHLVFSDGLATVSIYIEPSRPGSLAGASRMGAVNAAGRVVDGYQVTVVGEVPRQTVEKIGQSVQRRP